MPERFFQSANFVIASQAWVPASARTGLGTNPDSRTACYSRASIASQIRVSMLPPSKRFISWMPVGEVTLISVM